MVFSFSHGGVELGSANCDRSEVVVEGAGLGLACATENELGASGLWATVVTADVLAVHRLMGVRALGGGGVDGALERETSTGGGAWWCGWERGGAGFDGAG